MSLGNGLLSFCFVKKHALLEVGNRTLFQETSTPTSHKGIQWQASDSAPPPLVMGFGMFVPTS